MKKIRASIGVDLTFSFREDLPGDMHSLQSYQLVSVSKRGGT